MGVNVLEVYLDDSLRNGLTRYHLDPLIFLAAGSFIVTWLANHANRLAGVPAEAIKIIREGMKTHD